MTPEQVLTWRDPEAAFEACRLLLAAYKAGETSGAGIKWEDVDAAFYVACGAFWTAAEDDDSGDA